MKKETYIILNELYLQRRELHLCSIRIERKYIHISWGFHNRVRIYRQDGDCFLANHSCFPHTQQQNLYRNVRRRSNFASDWITSLALSCEWNFIIIIVAHVTDTRNLITHALNEILFDYKRQVCAIQKQKSVTFEVIFQFLLHFLSLQ